MRDTAAVSRFVGLYQTDAAAHDAARQAAIDAGEPKPQGLWATMGANLLEYQGQAFATTTRGKQRFQEAIAEQALQGATAYVNGIGGNAYTRFLANRFGSYSSSIGTEGDTLPPGLMGSRSSDENTKKQSGNEFWRGFYAQPLVVRYVQAMLFLVCLGCSGFFGFLPLQQIHTRGSRFEFWLISFSLLVTLPFLSVIFAFIISHVLLFFLGLLVTARDPGLGAWFRNLPDSNLLRNISAWVTMVVCILAPLGLFYGSQEVRDLFIGLSIAMLFFGFIVLMLMMDPLVGEGYRFLSKKLTVPGAGMSATTETQPSVPLPDGPARSVLPPGPPITSPADWREGCLHGDRFGPKQFHTVLHTDQAPLDILSHISRTLTQLGSVQPWRVVPTVKTSGPEGDAISFVANGNYSWDSSAHVAQSEAGKDLVQDISGHSKGGTGTVHLECTVVPCEQDDRVELVLQFKEAAHPMWMKRQAEGYVALTLRGLAEEGGTLGMDFTWGFRAGDWLTYQLLSYGGAPFELRPARG